jgi:hypothetical protein
MGLPKGSYEGLHESYKEQARKHKKIDDCRLKTIEDLKKEETEIQKKFGDYKKKIKRLLKQGKFEEFAKYTENHLKRVNKFNSDKFEVDKNKKIKNVYFDVETSCLGEDC